MPELSIKKTGLLESLSVLPLQVLISVGTSNTDQHRHFKHYNYLITDISEFKN